MLIAVIRTIILYLLIILGVRLLGKRQIGELVPSELVLSLIIADLAAVPMQDFGLPEQKGHFIDSVMHLDESKVVHPLLPVDLYLLCQNFRLRPIVPLRCGGGLGEFFQHRLGELINFGHVPE